ncbi:MAG TPA: flagellar biosynthetic protein FliR [Planctomycetaceae bacterium]|nr:flagellar biosynthetic protein FliR [Planctomycetaceae bacterium]
MFPSLTDFAGEYLLQQAALQVYAFTLVVVRLSGVMTTAPGFSNPAVPVNIRILIVLATAFLIAPNIGQISARTFHRLDVDRDGRLTSDEIPEQLQTRFDDLVARHGPDGPASVDQYEFRLNLEMPPSLLDYLWVAVGEFGIGLVLGLGIMTVLSALQLSGQIVDQQTGLGLGEVFNPELNASTTLSGDLLYIFGTTLFFIVGGHLLTMSALIDTFQTLPPGHASVSFSAIELLSRLVHQSLVLALQVIAPLLATMSIVSLAMGYLGHMVPQINVLVFGFPVRIVVGFVVMMAAMAGMGETTADLVVTLIKQLHASLTGLEEGFPT